MKVGNKVVGISILLGLLTGVTDSVVDYFMFYEKPFWDLLIFDVPVFEIYVRAIILAVFIISGFVVSNIMDKRSQAEQKIKQQKDFLNLVLDSLKYPLLVIDPSNYTISLANPAASTGRLPTGLTCYALTHKRDTPCNSAEDPCPMEIIKKTKKPITLEHIHYDKDGNPRYVEVHAHPVFNSKGNIFQVIEYSIDVTERKRADEALRESEERFRALFEQASVGVAEVDTKTGRFIRINQKYCDIAGYSIAEMMALTFIQITHPDDLQTDQENVRKIGEGEIRIYSREKRYIRKDGAIVWVHLTMSPIWEKGTQSTRHIAVVENITERKRMEEERDKLVLELQKTLSEVKTLRGFLPICSHCKKIRDDKGYWNQIESYIHKHSDAEFSHGICPECANKYYPDLNLYDK